MSVSSHARVYLSIYMCYLCIYPRVLLFIHINIYTRTYVHTGRTLNTWRERQWRTRRLYIPVMYIHIYVCIYMYIYISIYYNNKYRYIHMYVCTYAHTYKVYSNNSSDCNAHCNALQHTLQHPYKSPIDVTRTR